MNSVNNQYIIQGKLGEGGMGTVYLAEDTMLERLVAIKELNKSGSSDSEAFGNRFQQEALALAKLNHPNITHLYNFLPKDDTYWMVMEYVQGRTLEQWLSINGQLSPLLACSIMVQILEGLHHAHRKGIIHRDLKPANVMISDEGEVKIMDFGIARIRNSQRITQLGKSVGTLEYMSPEQIQGKEGDERTDVYAAGTILYELLCGRPPFKSDTDYHLMRAKLEENPVTLAGMASAPVAVQKAILRSLERHPEKRFENVIAFKNQLQTSFAEALLREQYLVTELVHPTDRDNRNSNATKTIDAKNWSQRLSLPSSLNFLSELKFDPKRFAGTLQMPKSIQWKNIRSLDLRSIRDLALANSIWILVGVILLCGSLILWASFSDPDNSSATAGGQATEISKPKDSIRPTTSGDILDRQFLAPVPVVNSSPAPAPVEEQGKQEDKETPTKKKEKSLSKNKPAEKTDDNTKTTVPPASETPPEEKKETRAEPKGPVDVPAGREIEMILAETISSEDRDRDGGTVRLYAGEDVQAGGRTIIKKGALIIGKIVDVVPSSKKRKSVIGFIAQKVEASNGTMIRLHSERFRLFSDNAGSPAIYKQGQAFEAKLGRGRVE